MSRIMNLIYVRYVIDVVVGVVENNDDDVHCESDNRLLPQLSSRSLTSHNNCHSSNNNNNRFMIFLFAIHYLLFLVLINLGLLIYWKIIWKMTTNPVFYGSLTKEWYDIWRKSSLPVVGAATTTTSATTTTELIDRPLTFEAAATDRLTISQIRLLFHNLEIFPTESQIYEMIQCASRCSGSATISTAKIDENSQKKYSTNEKECLTFGEFCYFASILQNSYQQQQNSFPTPNPLNASNTFYDKLDRIQQYNASRCDTIDDDNNASFEVFLGGSCNPTRWRTELVIPELKKHGITYYNPQVDHWGPDLIELENYAKQNSEILFFVIDNQTRAIASMIEVAFIASSERKLILSIDNLEWPNCKLTDGNMSIEEYNSLNKGRAYLRDVVERQGIPIFSEIPQALKSAIRVIKEQINPRDLTHQTDKIMPIRMGHISVADKMIQMFKVFELFKNDCKEFTFADLALAYRSLSNGKILSPKLIQQLALCHNRNSSKNVDCCVDDESCDSKRNIIANNLDKIVINFDQFCCIMTELNHLQDEATEAEQSSTKRSIRQTQQQHNDPLWIRSVKHFPAYLLERIAKFYHLLMSIIDETFSRKDELNNDDGVVNHHQYQYQQQPQQQPQQLTSHSSHRHHLQNPYSNVVRRHSYRRRLSSAYSPSSHHHHMAAPSPHQSSSVRYSYQTPSTPSAGYQSASSQSRRHSFTQSRSVATSTGIHHHYHHYLSPTPTQPSYNSSGQSTPSPMVGSNGGGRLSTSGSRHHGGSHFNHHLNQAESSSSITSLLYDTSLIDLFIGGEVDSKVMADSIIPLLKKNLITYCTPMLDAWTSQRMIPLQAKKYEICRCLLFIITKDTLDISFMILAAHYVGLGYNVVLCIQYMDLDDPKLLSKISVDAIKDYNRGRSYLSDLATKAGVRVFSDITEAIECSIDICSSSSNICDSTNPNGTNWD